MWYGIGIHHKDRAYMSALYLDNATYHGCRRNLAETPIEQTLL